MEQDEKDLKRIERWDVIKFTIKTMVFGLIVMTLVVGPVIAAEALNDPRILSYSVVTTTIAVFAAVRFFERK